MTRLCRSSWRILCRPRQAGVPASVRQPLPAPDVGRAGEHARSAPLHRGLGFFSDRHEEILKRVFVAQAGNPPAGRSRLAARARGADGGVLPGDAGHEVTVYDSKSEAGGMLRSRFRSTACRKRPLRREIELIERLGVKFHLQYACRLGCALNELADRFDSVFISIGTWRESWVYQRARS